MNAERLPAAWAREATVSDDGTAPDPHDDDAVTLARAHARRAAIAFFSVAKTRAMRQCRNPTCKFVFRIYQSRMRRKNLSVGRVFSGHNCSQREDFTT